MKASPTEPRPGASAHPRYVIILALAAGAILTVGGLLRPRHDDSAVVPQVPESEIARLQIAAQRRQLEDDTNYFRTVSADVGQAVTFLADLGTSGVAWTGQRFVTSGTLPAAGPTVAAPGSPQRPRRRPVVSTAAPSPVVPAPRVQGALRAGDWVLAVWDTGSERAFVPGRYVNSPSASCGATAVQEIQTTVPLSPGMSGAGLFDLYGNLLGVIASCGTRMAALTTTSVDAILADAASTRGRLLDRYGLEVVAVGPVDGEFFGVASGVLVQAVWVGDVADVAGLIPGDVILAVDETPVATMDDLAPLASAAAAAHTLRVQRAGDPVDVQLAAANDTLVDADTVALTPGFTIDNVPTDSAAAQAGLVAGDRVLRRNQTPIRNAAEARQLLAGPLETRTFVEVERGGRRSGIFIP